MPVYVGDEVRPGQLIARLDDAELFGREREAAAATQAAAQNANAAREQVSAAEAMRRQKASAAQAMTVGINEARRLAQAAARIASTQAEAARSALDNAGADLDAARADLAYWEAGIKRMKVLRNSGAASVDEYQVEEARYQTAVAMAKQKQALVAERKAMVRSAEAVADRISAGVATATAEVQAALTRIEQARANARAAGEEVSSNAAQVRVAAAQQRAMGAMSAQSLAALSGARTVRGYTEIRAASPARVLQRVVSPGTLVSPGALLLRLAQVDRVRLQAYVSQADLAGIRVGSRVWAARVDQPNRRIVAVVTSLSPSADPASRTSVVEAIIANPRRQFLPGQAVQLQIETQRASQAITVSNSAVITRQRTDAGGSGQIVHSVWTVAVQNTPGSTIYTCVMHPQIREKQPGLCPICKMPLVAEQAGGKRLAHQVEVIIGASDGQRTQILSGLQAGQEIITRGLQNLREGQAIQKVPWSDQGPLQLTKPAAGGMADMPGMDHSSHTGGATVMGTEQPRRPRKTAFRWSPSNSPTAATPRRRSLMSSRK